MPTPPLDAPAPDSHVRSYGDLADVVWRVHEYIGSTQRSLVFWSQSTVRRVRDYPTDWWTFTDAELVRISWRR